MVSTFSRKDQNYKNEDLNQPSKEGRFGKYGGQYVPETLMPALFELETAASNACLLYTSPSPRDLSTSRMPSSA